MNPFQKNQAAVTRRQFFGKSVLGIGSFALGSLLNPSLYASETGGVSSLSDVNALGLPHFAAKAKRVIYLF